MNEITDINDAGASAISIASRNVVWELVLNANGGAWNGATVHVQRNINGSWVTVASYTDDTSQIFETSVPSSFRTFTVHDVTPPTIFGWWKTA